MTTPLFYGGQVTEDSYYLLERPAPPHSHSWMIFVGGKRYYVLYAIDAALSVHHAEQLQDHVARKHAVLSAAVNDPEQFCGKRVVYSERYTADVREMLHDIQYSSPIARIITFR